MARHASTHVDPAADAAALLRRLGFSALMLAIPVAALANRRAVVVLAPVAIALLVIAALLDGEHRRLSRSAAGLLRSTGALAGFVLLVWCALSLLWTPFFGPASERLMNVVLTIAMALAGFASLPDRMRSANLYLVALGTGLAALVATGLALSSWRGWMRLDDEGQTLERGLVVLVMMAWPAIAWLRSREREIEALALAVAVAIAAMLGPGPMPFTAFAIAALVYGLTALSPKRGTMITAGALAGLLLAAPAIPFVLHPVAALVGNLEFSQALEIWRAAVTYEPVRLVTGHGFETALRARLAGFLPEGAPVTVLFEIWYELGIVGAAAAAVALHTAVQSAGRGHPALVPGGMAAFAAAFTFAVLGIGTAQMWWVTTLATVTLVFVAAERGQFRTTRPKAILSRLGR